MEPNLKAGSFFIDSALFSHLDWQSSKVHKPTARLSVILIGRGGLHKPLTKRVAMRRQLRHFGIIRCVCSFVFLFCYAIASPASGNEVMIINGIYYISNGKYHVEEIANAVFLVTGNSGVWVLKGMT
jgi:hypothetical protein